MGLFSKKKDSAATPEPAEPPVAPGQPVRKDRPTPSRREAEAARMARLHPELDPKKAKQLDRQARTDQRMKQARAVDQVPERQLMRDVVDSRRNVGEVALPAMLAIIVLFLIPQLAQYAEWSIFLMYGIIVMLALDYFLMWRRFKALATERLPGRSLRGLGFYGWNRQMSFRRWRQPAPRVQRGEKI